MPKTNLLSKPTDLLTTRCVAAQAVNLNTATDSILCALPVRGKYALRAIVVSVVDGATNGFSGVSFDIHARNFGSSAATTTVIDLAGGANTVADGFTYVCNVDAAKSGSYAPGSGTNAFVQNDDLKLNITDGNLFSTKPTDDVPSGHAPILPYVIVAGIGAGEQVNMSITTYFDAIDSW